MRQRARNRAPNGATNSTYISLPRVAVILRDRWLARMLLCGQLRATALVSPCQVTEALMNTPRTIRLSSEDNVVVAVDQIAAGSCAAGVTARERVPRGHKMAVSAIREGEPVRKYGQTIGFASKAISPGEWVHEQNVAMRDFARDYKFAEAAKNDETVPPELRATFEGYVRPNGKTGTRNYIGILTSVNCSASVAKFIAEEVNRSGILDRYPEIDGAVAFVHGSGCGMAAYGEGW